MQKKNIDRAFPVVFALAVLLAVPAVSSAAPINGRDENGSLTAMKDNIKLNSKDAKTASDLSKATGLSRSKISELMNKGYEEEDIKVVFTTKTLSGKKLEDVTEKYDELDHDQSKLLEEYKIDQKDYEKKYKTLFKSMEDGESHLRDRVKWRKVPFHD